MTTKQSTFEQEVKSARSEVSGRIKRAELFRSWLMQFMKDRQPNLGVHNQELERRRVQDTDRRISGLAKVVMMLVDELERAEQVQEEFSQITAENVTETKESTREIDVCRGATSVAEYLRCLRGGVNDYIRYRQEFQGYWTMHWWSMQSMPGDYRNLFWRVRTKLLTEAARLDTRIDDIDGGDAFQFSTEIFLAAREGTMMLRNGNDKYISTDDPAAVDTVPFNNKKLTELVAPTTSDGAATKGYVDGEISDHEAGVDPHSQYAKATAGISSRNTFGKQSWYQSTKPSSGFATGDMWIRTTDFTIFIYDGTRWLSTWVGKLRAGRAGTPAGNQHMIISGDTVSNAGSKSHRFDFDIRVVRMRIKSNSPLPDATTAIRLNYGVSTYDLNFDGSTANAAASPNINIPSGTDFNLQHRIGVTAATDYWAEITYREVVT